jgi:hypothetical protein
LEAPDTWAVIVPVTFVEEPERFTAVVAAFRSSVAG